MPDGLTPNQVGMGITRSPNGTLTFSSSGPSPISGVMANMLGLTSNGTGGYTDSFGNVQGTVMGQSGTGSAYDPSNPNNPAPTASLVSRPPPILVAPPGVNPLARNGPVTSPPPPPPGGNPIARSGPTTSPPPPPAASPVTRPAAAPAPGQPAGTPPPTAADPVSSFMQNAQWTQGMSTAQVTQALHTITPQDFLNYPPAQQAQIKQILGFDPSNTPYVAGKGYYPQGLNGPVSGPNSGTYTGGGTTPGTGGSTLPYGGQSPGTPGNYPDINSLFPNSGNGTSTNMNRTGLDPRLDALYQFALGQAISRYGDPNGQTYYNGQTVAPLTQDELNAQDMLRGLAGNMSSTSGNSMDYINTLIDRAKNPQNDPTLTAAINATTHNMDTQATDPGGVFSQIRQSALSNGSYGGTRQGVAEAVGADRLARAKADTEAQMRLAGRTENINAAQSGMQTLPTAISAAEAPASMLAGVGAQNRGQQQAIDNSNLNAWAYNTFAPDQRLQNLFNMLGASPLGGYSASASTLSPAQIAALQANTPQGASTGQNIAGGLAGVGAIYTWLHNAGLI